MNRCGRRWHGVWAVAALGATVGSVFGQQPDKSAALRAAGKEASLTVLPAGLGGSPSKQVGEVVGMLLERGGMKNLELAAGEFRPPDQADLAATGQALGEFVRGSPPKTDYVLFADFLGAPEKGVAEVRGLIVSKQGEVVWQDRQTPDDADFQRIKPQEPLQCCLLLAERLRPVLGLDDPTRAGAPEGKLAKRWQERTGLPDEAEQAALKERQQAFKKAAPTASLLIYPVRAGDAVSKECAADLVKLINDAKLAKAAVAAEGPALEIKGSMNEQKMLWEMARGVREYLAAHKPDADYVLYAQYLMGRSASGQEAVGGVHFAVCDRQGQWVIVDFQNDHGEDFRAVNPKSAADCDRLVVKRLEGYCR